jgi:hypothetical protein
MSILQVKPKECLLCNSSENIYYGDEEYGEMFCKLCFDKYSCFHCKKMNIKIQFSKYDLTNNEKNIYVSRNKDPELDIYEPYKYVQKKVEDVLYLKFGDKSRMFCDPCFKNENVYHDPNDDSLSINNNDEIDEYDNMDENEDEDDNEDNDYNDAYYVRRGKYDMY